MVRRIDKRMNRKINKQMSNFFIRAWGKGQPTLIFILEKFHIHTRTNLSPRCNIDIKTTILIPRDCHTHYTSITLIIPLSIYSISGDAYFHSALILWHSNHAHRLHSYIHSNNIHILTYAFKISL